LQTREASEEGVLTLLAASRKARFFRWALACSIAMISAGAALAADTLRTALTGTYETNPRLNAQREALKGTDAAVAIANSGGRPTVAATVGLNRDLTRSGILDTGRSKGPILSGGLDLNLPLFAGGRVRNAVEAAEARVEAGRAQLRAVEGDVFVSVVEAYMDVLRDRAVKELNDNQVRVLAANLQATNGLFNAGDLTRTDIAQSQARLSRARAQLALAAARLSVSEETYLRIVGRKAGDLAPPPPLPPLPATANEAVRIAMARNPSLTAALQQARAAGFDVRTVAADRLPSLSGVLGGDYVNYVRDENGSGFPRSGTQTTVGITTRIPLYQGGAPAARVRQARAAEGQLLEQTVNAEREVVANARSAFVTYQASLEATQSSQDAVSANEMALRGTRAERRVGTRTVIEVLNAEQELLDSQVQLIAARRDNYVAGFRLLEAMGQASSAELGLEGGPLYDPQSNYRRVAGNWNDWNGGARHQPRSTSTQKLAETTSESSPKSRAELAEQGAPRSQPPSPAPVQAAPKESRAVELAEVSPSATPDPRSRPSVPARPDQPAVVSSASSGRFDIQLGAFRTKGAPQALFDRVAGKLGNKEPTYVTVGAVTRLLVGPYVNRSEAQAACRSLSGQSGCLVVPRN
jgi:outer membrane protein